MNTHSISLSIPLSRDEAQVLADKIKARIQRKKEIRALGYINSQDYSHAQQCSIMNCTRINKIVNLWGSNL